MFANFRVNDEKQCGCQTKINWTKTAHCMYTQSRTVVVKQWAYFTTSQPPRANKNSNWNSTGHAYGCSGPAIWNSFPLEYLKTQLRLGVFKRYLKTFIYAHYYRQHCSTIRTLWLLCSISASIISFALGTKDTAGKKHEAEIKSWNG